MCDKCGKHDGTTSLGMADGMSVGLRVVGVCGGGAICVKVRLARCVRGGEVLLHRLLGDAQPEAWSSPIQTAHSPSLGS